MLELSRSRIFLTVVGVVLVIIGIIVNNSILHSDGETEINRKKLSGTILTIIGMVLISWANGLGLFFLAIFGDFFGIKGPSDGIDYYGIGNGQ
jgi:uncharacterized membrane protein